MGITPRPCLPVDSATNCSIHAANAAIEGEARTVSLSRPFRARTPIVRPSDAGVFGRRHFGPASFGHGAGNFEESADVMTARRQRHQSEFGQHRKAPADARNT